MLATFPEDYPRYRQRVTRLISGLRPVGRRKVADMRNRLTDLRDRAQ